MLKNYLKITLRNIRKNPGYSFINIFGLALGMAICILILLFVQYELSYDTYHDNSDRIVRISREWFNQTGETSLHLGHVAPPFAPLLKSDFEGTIQEAVRFLQTSPLISYEDKSFVENRFFFADPEVFEIFSWGVIQGDPESALSYPDGIIITQNTAQKYFGNEDPMGKSLELQVSGQTFQIQVRAVIENIPENSHFQFDILASMQPVVQFYGGQEAFMQNFGSNNFATYLLLPEGYEYQQLQAQLPAFIDRHMSPISEGISASRGTQLNLWPLTDIHLYSHLDSEIEANGHIEYIYIYLAIAFFILVIACINFMNLSTARSSKRAVEVGLRKSVGADRGVLIRQFIGEAVLLAVISLTLAVILVELLLPWFNNFVGKPLELGITQNWIHILALSGIIVFVGVVAGSYPAFFLSGFQPATVLKGSFKVGGAHERFRSVLVVSQFSISIALIASMLIVHNQLGYMQSKDLGFDKENIVVLPSSPYISSHYKDVRQQLLQHPGIINVSVSSRVPSGRLLDSQGTTAEVNGELLQINTRIADIHVSHNFMETYGIELTAGRDFNFDLTSDSTEAFILNESAVEAIGWADPEEAIGKEFHYGGRRGRITGVVQDFNFESLHQSIAPIVFMIPDSRTNNISVKIREGMRTETLSHLEEEWAYWRPGFPFSYSFVADNFDEQYDSEKRLEEVFGYFSLVAFIIAALGLFGLASFSTQQRMKEIGVRKILGASVTGIVGLLSKDFLKLVLIGFFIATPLAWFAMKQWLSDFAYRIDIGVDTFLLAGAAALIIALLTVSWQSIKAALANPVDSLRSE